MTKSELASLLQHRHLSARELARTQPELASVIEVAKRTAANTRNEVEPTSDDSDEDDTTVDRPIAADPDLGPLLDQARLHEIGSLAKLAPQVSDAVVAAISAPALLGDRVLDRLVAAGTLRDADARELGVATALYRLAGDDVALAKRIREARPSASTRDLARLSEKDWLGIAGDAATARVLADRFAALHPVEAFLGRLPASAAVERAHALVGDVLFDLDLSPASADLDRLGASGADRDALVSTLKPYQRALALTRHVDDAQRLLAAGYRGSAPIARVGVDEVVQRSGIPIERAEDYWRKARRIVAESGQALAGLVDLWGGLFGELAVGTVAPDVRDYLRQLPGYAGLFGNLAYCSCEHCQSVLGPAAYFVDLMTYVTDHILGQFSGLTDHPLDLAIRRGDLWKLPLTCANTDDVVPTLELVDEVLERFVARATLGADASLDAVQAVVYQRVMPATTSSFAQPFHLAQDRIALALVELGSSRAEVTRAMTRGEPTNIAIATAELGVSLAQRRLLDERVTTLSRLATLYDLPLAAAGALDHLDVHEMGRATALSRDELGELIATDFVRIGNAALSIVAYKLGPDSIQNDAERLAGVTVDVLDRMHRFTRLRRALPWKTVELDHVLTALGARTIDDDTLRSVARVRAAQRQLDADVDETCALFGPIPDEPAGTSLFDQVFNPPDLPRLKYPPPGKVSVYLPWLRRTETSPDIPRLLAGLGIDLEELTALQNHLATILDTDHDPATARFRTHGSRGNFIIDRTNLTLMYRHARLARRLRVSIDELFQLIDFAHVGGHIAGLDGLDALVDLHAWWRTTTLSLDDLAVAIGRDPREATSYLPEEAGAVSAYALDLVGGARDSLAFQDTIFAVALGVPEPASREILSANPDLVEPADTAGRWRVRAGVDPATATVQVPATATVVLPQAGTRVVTAAELAATLLPYTPARVMAVRLGTALDVDPDRAAALARLAGRPLGDIALARALIDETSTPELAALIVALRPLAVAFADPVWDVDAIDAVREHPASFGLALPAITVANVRALSVYARIAARPPAALVAPTPDQLAAHRQALRAALLQFDPSTGDFPPAANAALGRVLDVGENLVAGLADRLAATAIAAEALDRLDGAARLGAALGVEGAVLSAIARGGLEATAPDDAVERELVVAADALRLAIRRRHDDVVIERQAALDRIDQPDREHRRDALVDYLLHATPARPWRLANDLYEYFLIDVSAGGCATTSRLVSAISSVQLYIQRVLLNLERTVAGAPHPIAVKLAEPAASEWSWRKNYRVWEANRKIFLWPENYIEPDLRDDKTPLFRDLESELLQTELRDQDVVDAYSKYLAGFEELASLSVAGAYHDIAPKPREGEPADVLHLFGVAPTDPPTCYYRTCEDLRARGDGRTPLWSPWQKTDVPVTSRFVSPLVYQNRLHLLWTKIATRSINQAVSGGTSRFDGYFHKLTVQLATLRPDGTWTAPQLLHLPGADLVKPGSGFSFGEGVIEDRPLNGKLRLKFYANIVQTEPVDGYTLFGPNWEWLWLEPARDEYNRAIVAVALRNFSVSARIDLFRRTMSNPRSPDHADGVPAPFQVLAVQRGGILHRGVPSNWPFNASGVANMVLEYHRLDEVGWEDSSARSRVANGLANAEAMAKLGAHPNRDHRTMIAIPGSPEDVILQLDNDVLLLQGSITDDNDYILTRIGTTRADTLARTLFTGGIDALLALPRLRNSHGDLIFHEFKHALHPPTAGGSIVGIVDNTTVDAPKIDYLDGTYRTYYEELFFHIPFTIANALNARGKFAEAQRWYHYIFDPTATSVWRYVGFGNLGRDKLRETLRDEAALRVYHEDPGNPFAIARLRPTAFQKAIVMKYVANLIDWGDYLFAQFTTESVNEALQLYVLASQILGPRPARLGDCGEAAISPRDYATIAPQIDRADHEEILIELETVIEGGKVAKRRSVATPSRYVVDDNQIRRAAAIGAQPVPVDDVSDPPTPLFRGLAYKTSRVAVWGPALGAATRRDGERPISAIVDRAMTIAGHPIEALGISVTRQLSPVFCFPANPDLLAYWDRVEDRLYKIRHCLDLDGEARELALFAPEIDPRLLVQARAAGLSLEEVLGATSGSLPPYRFQYLIDRAKAFAVSVSSFGAALLASMEKRDNEQLARVRLVQQQNLARLTTQLRRWDIEVAEESYQAVVRQQEAATYRRDYFAGLVDQNRNGWEIAQSVAQHLASAIYTGESASHFVAAALYALPQVGSPFAMKYGGLELGNSYKAAAVALDQVAKASDSIGKSAALEAGFARRSEGWEHQRQLAIQELRQLDRTLRATDYRRQIAQRALDLHQKSIDHLDELLALGDGKFTNRGLYDFMATKLRRIYRDGYANALALAKLAEQAFRFERGDETAPRLEATYWDPVHAGLLAGEQLLIALEGLERRFLETNYRTLEVDQAFALSQLAPGALVELRETGECRFMIPELAFDLFYPGQYNRRIRAVRLTIPCITGPYVNVSATLTLDRSWLRPTPTAPLAEVPPRRSVSIATSTAQNDAGVFELSFRDERYMPFEGAGAISAWHLALPRTLRQFNYQTMNDVILSVSYAAELDGVLRDRIEATVAATVQQLDAAPGVTGSALDYLRSNASAKLFSLRHDFSSSFTRLLLSPVNTPVKLDISAQQFPAFIGDHDLDVTDAILVVRGDRSPDGFAIRVDDALLDTFAPQDRLGGLFGAALPAAVRRTLRGPHTFVVTAAGAFDVSPRAPGDVSAVSADRLLDVLLYVEYRVN